MNYDVARVSDRVWLCRVVRVSPRVPCSRASSSSRSPVAHTTTQAAHIDIPTEVLEYLVSRGEERDQPHRGLD
eukprot:1741602-Prymnesium_polylepis.1